MLGTPPPPTRIPSVPERILTPATSFLVRPGHSTDHRYLRMRPDVSYVWQQRSSPQCVEGEDIPYGTKGIYFSGTGRFTWRSLAEAVGKAGKSLGVLDEEDVKEITLDEAAGLWTGGSRQIAELGFASK